MKEVKREITKEEYELSKEKSAYALIGDDIKMGYGACGARTYILGDKYYLSYDCGSSCD